MINFRKVFNSKIILLLIAFTFSFEGAVYPISDIACHKADLRVPLDAKSIRSRWQRVVDRIKKPTQVPIPAYIGRDAVENEILRWFDGGNYKNSKNPSHVAYLFQENFLSNDNNNEYLEGLIRLVYHLDKEVQLFAIHTLWYICQKENIRYYPPFNKLDLSMSRFLEALESDRERLNNLIDTLVSDLDNYDIAALSALQHIGSVVELPESFFVKMARFIASGQDRAYFNDLLINTLHSYTSPQLSRETLHLFESVLNNPDARLYVKRVLITELFARLSAMQKFEPEILKAILIDVPYEDNDNSDSSLILSASMGILGEQSRFGVLAQESMNFIIDILTRHKNALLLDKAAISLGMIAKAYKQQGEFMQLEAIKERVIQGYLLTTTEEGKTKWAVSLIEVGHSIKLDEGLIAELRTMEISLEEAAQKLSSLNNHVVICLKELPIDVNQDRLLMDALPDQETGLDVISMEGDSRPFVVVRKGEDEGVLGSRIADFNLHSHPKGAGGELSNERPRLEVIPSALDLRYVLPETFDEYIWARNGLWKAEYIISSGVIVSEDNWLFRHNDGTEIVVSRYKLDQQEQALEKFNFKKGIFSIYVNYGRLGIYKITYEPGLTIREAWQRTTAPAQDLLAPLLSRRHPSDASL